MQRYAVLLSSALMLPAPLVQAQQAPATPVSAPSVPTPPQYPALPSETPDECHAPCEQFDQVAAQLEMGGYQLMVSADIFRGRYRETLTQARPLSAATPLP